jgi:hypothetical protein
MISEDVDPSDTFDVEIHDHRVQTPIQDVWPCGASVMRTGQQLADMYLQGWHPDFPSDLYTECPAAAQEDADGLGWSCTAGHTYRSPTDVDHLAGF